MKTLLLLVLSLLCITPALADEPLTFEECMNSLSCLAQELRNGQRLNASDRARESAALDVLDTQAAHDRAIDSIQPSPDEWLLYQTPHNGSYTNIGDGWMMDQQGRLYVPY